MRKVSEDPCVVLTVLACVRRSSFAHCVGGVFCLQLSYNLVVHCPVVYLHSGEPIKLSGSGVTHMAWRTAHSIPQRTRDAL